MRLLESSNIKKKQGAGGTLFSIIFHSAVLFLVVYATAQARDDKPEPKPRETVNFVKPATPPEPKPPEPEPPKAKPAAAKAVRPSNPSLPKVAVPAPALGFKTLSVPVDIPTKIPEIDLTAAVTSEADFSGKGVKGGISTGVKGSAGGANSTGTIAGSSNAPYSESEVDEAVVALGGAEPSYPEALRSARVEGQVMAQFVVDERGRYQSGSFKVLNDANPMFVASVRAALPRMRFKPAKINGKPVKQLVQQPFHFQLQG